MSYTIDGSDFSIYNMQVTSCKGFLDMPGRLGDVEHDWADSNGVQAYTEAADMKWDGREIKIFVFYDGSDMESDVASLISDIAGSEVSLVADFGTYTVSLKKITTRQVFVPQQKGILEITFWEPVVSVPSVPSAIGIIEPLIGGYSFVNDFGLHLKSSGGFTDIPEFNERKLTYGDTAVRISQFRKNRKIRLSLNGKFASVGTMVDNIEDLHAVLRSSGVKTLTYKGISKSVYFANKCTVDVDAWVKATRLTLTLRISE